MGIALNRTDTTNVVGRTPRVGPARYSEISLAIWTGDAIEHRNQQRDETILAVTSQPRLVSVFVRNVSSEKPPDNVSKGTKPGETALQT